MRNTVWISTAPRTGSMWLFNITRQLIVECGLNLHPKDVPQSEGVMFNLYERALLSRSNKDIWVLKIHRTLKNNLPNSRVLSIHRDPRDIVVSYMEFMRFDFQHSLQAAKDVIAYTDTYRKYSPEYVKLIPYADIEADPAGVIRGVADFLKLRPADKAILSIADKFSKHAIRQRIDALDSSISERRQKNLPLGADETITISDDNIRSYDTQTGFQSGHVSQRNTGDWQKILEPSQIAEVNAIFKDWLVEYGYV